MATSILVQQIQALAQRAATEDKLIKGLLVTAEGAIRTDFAAADTLLGGRITTLDTKVDGVKTDLTALVTTTRTAIETDFNGKIGDVTALTTTAKGNIVVAVNEVKTLVDAAKNAADSLINDTTASATTVYSATKTNSQISAAINALVGPGTDEALNTLRELGAALGDDADFASNITAAIGEKSAKAANLSDLTDFAAARTNLVVYSKSEVVALIKAVTDTIGDVTALDAVATFDATIANNPA